MPPASSRYLFQNQKLAKRLKQVTEVICQKLDPEKIVLFGSYAKGEADEWSDLDLIIISSKVKDKREIDRVIFIDRFLQGIPPIQPFVFTPEEYQKMLRMKSSILQYALPKAKVIYEKRR